MRGLYESLLGGFDNIANEIDSDVLLKPNGELIRQGTDYKVSGSIYGRGVNYKQDLSSFKNGTLSLAIDRYELGSGSKSFHEFFPSIKELVVPGKFINNGIPINPDTICNTITCGEYIYRCSWNAKQNALSDIEINITKDFGKLNSCMGRAIQQCLFNVTGPNPSFSNVIINFDSSLPNTNKAIIFGNDTLLDLSGIKSNAKVVKFHDTFAIEDDEKVGDFAKLFDWSWACPTYDAQKRETVMRPIKNWKTLAATLNNPKRYRSTNGEFFIKLKKGAKLTDYFDLSGFKDLDTIEMWNNNIEIVLTKNPAKIKSAEVWANKPMDLSKLIKNWDWPHTEDGWYIFGGKHL